MFDYKDLMDKDFSYGGRGPDTYDCYGLVIELYKRLGIDLVEYESSSNFNIIAGRIEDGRGDFSSLPSPEPYCLVTFRIHPKYITHIGMVLEDATRFIHILENSRVSVERLNSQEWKWRIAAYHKYKL